MSRTDVLVDANWLLERADDPRVAVVEVELEDRELVADVPVRKKTAYIAAPLDWSLRDEVVASIGVKDIIDVRSPDEFTGKITAPAAFDGSWVEYGSLVGAPVER